MFLLAVTVERVVLRPLVNQPDIILFMATIGLNSFLLEGVADLMWGSEIKKLDVCLTDALCLPQGINTGIDAVTYEWFGYGFFIDNLDIAATLVAILLVIALVAFSQYTKQGRAMRAVADDHQAALSVGDFAELHLGAGLVAGGFRGAGRRYHVGCQVRRAVLAVADRAEGAAGADAGRLHVDPGRHRRRPDHRGGREAVRVR
jgi:branched-subunit amino acid ABC-type transport system permease component